MTMRDADRAFEALAVIVIGVAALAFPFVASGYHESGRTYLTSASKASKLREATPMI